MRPYTLRGHAGIVGVAAKARHSGGALSARIMVKHCEVLQPGGLIRPHLKSTRLKWQVLGLVCDFRHS